MYARFGTYHGAPNRVKEGGRVIDEITSELQQMPGFQHAFLLIDGKGGKAYSISTWGTEDEANRSTSPAGHMREKIAKAVQSSGAPTVEILEVGAIIGEPREGTARFARVSEYRGSPGKADEGIRAAKSAESSMKGMQGFDHAVLFLDRKSGRAITISFWDSERSLHQSETGVSPVRQNIASGLGHSGTPKFEIFEVAGEVTQRARRAA